MCIVRSSHSLGLLKRAPFCETRKCVHQWQVRDLCFGSSNLESNRYFFGGRGKWRNKINLCCRRWEQKRKKNRLKSQKSNKKSKIIDCSKWQRGNDLFGDMQKQMLELKLETQRERGREKSGETKDESFRRVHTNCAINWSYSSENLFSACKQHKVRLAHVKRILNDPLSVACRRKASLAEFLLKCMLSSILSIFIALCSRE